MGVRGSGVFQIVTVMWLDDNYCDLDTIAADLTGLSWLGIALVGR